MSIVVEQMSHIYNLGAPQQRVALHDISLTIPDGACAAIVGVTGSGKSTLTQHFNGLLLPTSGRVIIDGLDVAARTTRPADILALRRRVGLLFQFPEAQLFAPTIADDVAFGPRQLRLKSAQVTERVRWALHAVALPTDAAFLARSPFALSGGQRRRVALAGVLAMRPLTLVLDEPSAGLDAEARDEIYVCLAALRAEEGVTLVIVSHDMSEVAKLADLVFALADGKLRRAGPPDEVFRRTEEIAACGLLPPPLAQALTLALAQGMAVGPTALTPDALADAILATAPASSNGHASQNDLNSHATQSRLNGHRLNGQSLNGHAGVGALNGYGQPNAPSSATSGAAGKRGNGAPRRPDGSDTPNGAVSQAGEWRALYDATDAPEDPDRSSGLQRNGGRS